MDIDLEFKGFRKLYRLYREIIITEKIDGTNAQILISDDGKVRAGSRNRYIDICDDNYGFAGWVHEHEQELLQLGPGRHFGEWWGRGIQRGYGAVDKYFTLFHSHSIQHKPNCVSIAPVLYKGPFDQEEIDKTLINLRDHGSVISPGFKNPEGIVIYHSQSDHIYKITLDKEDKHKWQM